jgi:hypothetical protein
MDGDQFVCLVQTLAPERLTKVLFPSLHLTITVIVHCRHRYTGKTAEEAGMVHAARPDAHSTLQEAVKIGMRVPCIYSLGEQRTKRGRKQRVRVRILPKRFLNMVFSFHPTPLHFLVNYMFKP